MPIGNRFPVAFPIPQVRRRGLAAGYRVLRVDQQKREYVGIALQRFLEVVISLVAASGCDDLWLWSVAEGFLKERVEGFAACSRSIATGAWAASLDKDADLHQRVPPSCPFVHNCPRL